MSRLTSEAMARATRALVDADLELAEAVLAAPTAVDLAEQETTDDAIDQLQRVVLDQVRTADPPYPTQAGIDIALLARYFERFADQAVTVTKQLDYMVTGQRTS